MRSLAFPPFLAPLDASNPLPVPTKAAPNRFLFRTRFLIASWIVFFGIFEPNMAPTCLQNPPKSMKIDTKLPSHQGFIFWSIFLRFFLPTWTPEPRKFMPPQLWEHDFLKIAFRCSHGFLVRFWSQLGSILPSQIHQNPSKSDPKSHLNFDRFLLRFFLDSGSVLGT